MFTAHFCPNTAALPPFNRWPGSFTYLQTSRGRKLVKIWSATVVPDKSHKPATVVHLDKQGIVVATGEGGLRITELQIEGGRRVRASEFVLGHDVQVGT